MLFALKQRIDISSYQYDRFTTRHYKPGELLNELDLANVRNLNYLLIWRYPVETTKRVSNRWADMDSKRREQKVDQINSCCKIKNAERYNTASRPNHEINKLNYKVLICSVNHRLINKRQSLFLRAILNLYLSKRNTRYSIMFIFVIRI